MADYKPETTYKDKETDERKMNQCSPKEKADLKLKELLKNSPELTSLLEEFNVDIFQLMDGYNMAAGMVKRHPNDPVGVRCSEFLQIVTRFNFQKKINPQALEKIQRVIKPLESIIEMLKIKPSQLGAHDRDGCSDKAESIAITDENIEPESDAETQSVNVEVGSQHSINTQIADDSDDGNGDKKQVTFSAEILELALFTTVSSIEKKLVENERLKKQIEINKRNIKRLFAKGRRLTKNMNKPK